MRAGGERQGQRGREVETETEGERDRDRDRGGKLALAHTQVEIVTYYPVVPSPSFCSQAEVVTYLGGRMEQVLVEAGTPAEAGGWGSGKV